MLKVAVLVLLLASCALAQNVVQTQAGNKTTFTITWRTNPTPAYDMYLFNKGDEVILSWSGFHDAVVVPDSADPCATAPEKYIKTLSEAVQGGEETYVIDGTEDFWIICTVPGHCSDGQKIMFMPSGSPSSHTTTPSTGMMPPPKSVPSATPSTTSPAPSSTASAPGSAALMPCTTHTLLAAVFGAVMLLAAFC